MNKTAIIGAGAAGIMAAVIASENTRIDLFEKNSKIGKKISVSGNGRCNISNANLSSEDYFTHNLAFVKYVLKRFGFKDFERFCKNIALTLTKDEEGRVYPLSKDARSVITLLEKKLRERNVKIYTNSKIIDIKKQKEGFIIQTESKKYQFYDKVMLAAGSAAASHLGGGVEGYEIARKLGHDIKTLYPSLVQLELNSKTASKMAGVKKYGKISLYIDSEKVQTLKGDILFTNYGVSGLGILDISQKASFALKDKKEVEIGLDLMMEFERAEFENRIKNFCKEFPKYDIETILYSFISPKIACHFLKDLNIDPKKSAKEINQKLIKKICYYLKDWRFKVKDTHGYRYAEVCGGGIDLSEVNEKNMESKLVKGLYFGGEILDVVGKRGGYNLHFAWASGYLAGKGI